MTRGFHVGFIPIFHCYLFFQAGQPVAAEIRRQILKIFYALSQYILPLELLDEATFTKWMEVRAKLLTSLSQLQCLKGP